MRYRPMFAINPAVLVLSSVLAFGQSEPSAASVPSPPAVPAQVSQPVKSYHDGSVRDIDAIGNRNIGCQRSMGNWYSLEKQIEMGRSYSQQVESASKMI